MLEILDIRDIPFQLLQPKQAQVLGGDLDMLEILDIRDIPFKFLQP